MIFRDAGLTGHAWQLALCSFDPHDKTFPIGVGRSQGDTTQERTEAGFGWGI